MPPCNLRELSERGEACLGLLKLLESRLKGYREAVLKGLRGWNQALACRHAAPVSLDAARAFQISRIQVELLV